MLLGVYLAGGALRAMTQGHWFLVNYLHLRVPAPLAFVVGVGLLIAGVLGAGLGEVRRSGHL